MQEISRTSWVFQVAYMFTLQEDEPVTVDRCSLVWRFALHLLPYLFLALVAWVVCGVVLGVIGNPLTRAWLFFAQGEKLVYGPAYDHVSFIFQGREWMPCRSALERLNVFSYRTENIDWFDRHWTWDGFRFTPGKIFVLVFGSLFVIGLFASLGIAMFGLLSPVAWYVYDTAPAWGRDLGILALFCGFVLMSAMAWQRFSESESGKLLATHMKEFREKHCTLYKVV